MINHIDEKEPDEGVMENVSKLKEQSNFFWGILLGLLLGIVGNLFVSHFYGMFSAGIKFHLGEERLFYYNLLFAVGLFIIMVVISWTMYSRIKHFEYVSSKWESYYWRKKRFLRLQKEAQNKRKNENDEND